jgi:predicted DNA-binding transcriptional regulator YafY
MNQAERLYRIDQLIRDRTVISFDAMKDELEVSRATLRRDITALRERYNAPIEYDRDAGGYRYGKDTVGPRFQLPGLWFSADEALALLTMHQMLQSLDSGGLLGPHVKPLGDRLQSLLGSDDTAGKEILKRVKIIPSQQRHMELKWFQVVGRALVSRKRLSFRYWSRHRDGHSEREVSPQRLVHYRNNWYLDAWCHAQDQVRMFSLDAMEDARLLDTPARNVSLEEVDRELGAGYGIYRGRRIEWAELHFNAEAARWVRFEVWHPQQKGQLLADGSYVLKLPYSGSTELVMDILRHAENVTVVGPPALREQVAARLDVAAAAYRGAPARLADSTVRSARWSRDAVIARKTARDKTN